MERNPKIGSTELKRLNGADDDETEVSANKYLLIQVILFLPPKPLLRFKSVSKPWRSLISSRRFRLLQSSRFRKDISGILLQRSQARAAVPENHRYNFLPLNGDRLHSPGYPTFGRFNFVEGERDGLVVLQSCNGLLLCNGYDRTSFVDVERNYYVVNPTTKEYTAFSGKVFDGVYDDLRVTLILDPRKSTYFKLICICFSMNFTDSEYEDEDDDEDEDVERKFDLRVYSLENGIVAQIGDTVRIDNTMCLDMDEIIYTTGVYWNDAINWIGGNYGMEGTYFNVDEQRFGKFPMPPKLHIKGCNDEDRWIRYVGESNDHFYLICTECAPTTQLHIYEMDIGYSGWSLRFCIDLQPIFRSFPEAVNPRLRPSQYHYKFEIRGMVEIEKDGDEKQFLFLTIPRKIIRFNLKDESFTKVCDYATEVGLGTYNRSPGDNDSFPIIQSLYPL